LNSGILVDELASDVTILVKIKIKIQPKEATAGSTAATV
jgi:hypothetical protein